MLHKNISCYEFGPYDPSFKLLFVGVQPVYWSALHILRVLELLPRSQVTSGDYQITYASPCIMTKASSRSRQAILIKELLYQGCSD
jgi:hypothetical protein